MSEPIRVWLLLARFPGDDRPSVVGGIDRTIWEHWEETDERAWVDDAKRRFGMDPTDMEWAHAWVEVTADDLASAFNVPIIQGIVSEEPSG